MDTKHTPGPWQPKPENDYVPAQVWDANGRQLCEVYGETRETRLANTQIMASAPRLLFALRGMLAAYAPKADFSKPNELHTAVREAGEAIANAMGVELTALAKSEKPSRFSR